MRTPPQKYLPWPWAVTPLDSSAHTCPSTRSILLTYFGVNCLTALLGISLSHRMVVRKISFGLLGKDQSTSWKWMWIVQLGLHFGADLIVAYITTHTDGYDQEARPATWDLALFYASRPRMAWIWLSFLGKYQLKALAPKRRAEPTVEVERTRLEDTALPTTSRPRSHNSLVESIDLEDGVKIEMLRQDPKAQENIAADANSHTQLLPTQPVPAAEDVEDLDHIKNTIPVEGRWTSAAKQTLITEAIMQVVGSYYLGRTAHFATIHNFTYPVNTTIPTPDSCTEAPCSHS
jgi:hypothetical protein